MILYEPTKDGLSFRPLYPIPVEGAPISVGKIGPTANHCL
jgi:hypothetical protein